MARPRVVHLLGTSGRNFWLHDVVVALARQQLDVSVVTVAPPGPLHDDLVRAGIPAHALGSMARHDVPRMAMRLRELIRQEQADTLHVHQVLPSLIARLATVGRRPASLLTRHEQPEFLRLAPIRGWKRSAHRMLDALSVRWPDIVIAPSIRARNDLLTLGVGAGRIRIVPLGFALESIARTDRAAAVATRADFGIHGRPVAVSVGRLSWEKDHATLLRAWHRVVQQHKDAILVICGEGPLRDRLRALAEELDIGGSVLLPGFRPDARAIMAAADVVVHSSLTESTGMVFIEALLLERPLVTTPVGIVGEHVMDREHCTVVPPGDADAMAAAVLGVIAAPVAAAERARRGQLRVRERFGLADMIRSYRALYGGPATGSATPSA